jgi:hypothetical protein
MVCSFIFCDNCCTVVLVEEPLICSLKAVEGFDHLVVNDTFGVCGDLPREQQRPLHVISCVAKRLHQCDTTTIFFWEYFVLVVQILSFNLSFPRSSYSMPHPQYQLPSMSEAHTSASLFLYYAPSLSLIFSLSSPPLLLHLPCSVHRHNLQSMVSALWRPHHLRPGLLGTRSARSCPLRRRSSEGAPPHSLLSRSKQGRMSSTSILFVTTRVCNRPSFRKVWNF